MLRRAQFHFMGIMGCFCNAHILEIIKFPFVNRRPIYQIYRPMAYNYALYMLAWYFHLVLIGFGTIDAWPAGESQSSADSHPY